MSRDDPAAISAPPTSLEIALAGRFAERASTLGVAVETVTGLEAVADLVAWLVADGGGTGPLVLAPGVAWAYPALRERFQARGLSVSDVRPEAPGATFPDALAGIGVSTATFGVAETGSLVVADTLADRLARMLAHTHVVLLERDRIVASLDDLAGLLRALALGTAPVAGAPSPARHLSIITGPSRTADIEMSLTVGAHGPARLIVAILESRGETGVTRGARDADAG